MYFRKFSNINYPFYKKDKVLYSKTAINITQRAKIIKYVKQYRTEFQRYLLKDGERPDTLAHRLYDNPYTHWVIYLVNDIFNPYLDWSMSQYDLNEYIDEIYPGSSVFVPDVWKPRETDESTTGDLVYVYDVLENFSIDSVSIFTLENSSFFVKKILSFADLAKITKSPKVKIYTQENLFETSIIDYRSEYYEIVVDRKNWNVNLFDGSNEFLIYEIERFGVKTCVKVPITRFIDRRRYSPKSFNDENGAEKDPSKEFTLGLNYGDDPYSNFVDPSIPRETSSLIQGNFANNEKDSFADVFSKRGEDGQYINPSFYKTFEQHELELNESKRSILIPTPSSVQKVIESFEEIINNP